MWPQRGTGSLKHHVQCISSSCRRHATHHQRPYGLHSRTLTTSTSSDGQVRTIAVLGGGISGLASAIYLSRYLKKAQGRIEGRSWKILLVERQGRTGGWVHSRRADLPGSTGTALLESGPRSLRPAGYSGLVMLDLIRSLSLWPRLMLVPKSASAAQNRFIYYPDKLSRLPSSLLSALGALRLPVLRGIVSSLLSEPFTQSRFWRPKSESQAELTRQRQREAFQDESVDAFITRRFGGRPQVAQNLVSAVIHGIYAGDSRTLSVRSVLPFLWKTESKYGSLLRAMLPASLNKRFRSPLPAEKAREGRLATELRRVSERLGHDLVESLKGVSMYSFPEGVEEITRAMTEELRAAVNVEIWDDTECVSISEADAGGQVKIHTTRGERSCHRVIAAIPSTALAKMLPSTPLTDRIADVLTYNTSSNVGVVNFAIPAPLIQQVNSAKNRLLPVEGFGFLVPRSTPNNEEALLGVVFDSDALPTQDGDVSSDRPTKLTVMMGGTTHWPSSLQPVKAASRPLPSTDELRASAIRALRTTLSIPASLLENPQTVVRAHLQRDAIPQYLVGHPVRMASLHAFLTGQTATTGGPKPLPLTLVGASYTGVSLNDCVANAERTIRRIVRAELLQASSQQMAVSGLEEFEEPTIESERQASEVLTDT